MFVFLAVGEITLPLNYCACETVMPSPVTAMRISYTLFRYVFWDLLRIFLMASGALAGIMSFGGLLRPLTQQGLDAGQVGQLLTYFTPAMTAYSFPIAALFATTMVYGRLSADNELTACRAAGINLISIALPAIALGAVVTATCLVFLSFVVPACMLRSERVLYSNLAKLFAGRIQRDHQVPIGPYNIFAQSAYLPPPESLGPHEQRVVLLSPMIIKMNRPYGKEDWQYKVPEEFWTSQSATAYIREAGGDANPELTVALNDGMRFPRSLQGAVTGAVGATQFGPVQLQSAVKENSRFMDLRQLLRLRQRPEESRRIQLTLAEFVNYDQEQKYLSQLQTQLNATFRYAFRTTEDEEFVLTLAEGASAALRGREVVVSAGGNPTDAKARAPFSTAGAETAVRLVRRNPRAAALTWQARELHVRVWPRRGSGRIDISLKLLDVALPGEADSSPVDRPVESQLPQASDVRIGDEREPKGVDRAALPITFRVPMPDTLQELERRPLAHYLSPAAAASGNQPRLKHDLLKLRNDLISEMHGRAALALSSLILVSVGCSLGMMFRSGNFLTAFAVSFVPALLAITLIIAGQQTCGNVPYQKVASASDTLRVGVVLIWSGNFVNLLLGTGLLWRLGRT